MKNRKKLALLAFAASIAVLSWVYPQKEAKAGGTLLVYTQFCYHQDSCNIVAVGNDCLAGGNGCISNPCPSGSTPMQ
ncbi:MAG: hypothetical protein MUE81_11720 [Thermoflexibacter sp.]|jgi:hypothetical protein|nr:hypothetical protein [Thermoflexibacter sp.]